MGRHLSAFVFSLLCLTALSGAAMGQDAAPPDGANPDMVKNYLFRLSDEAFAQRQAQRDALSTPEEIAEYQADIRRFFAEALGGFWEKGPLNAKVVGNGERDGFRYEKVMYDSLPGMPITAVLFLPVTEGPYPGVLVPCGHDATGKACEAYQRLCIMLARNGIAALIYDPIGQGERVQILTDEGKAKYSSTIEHTVVGTAAIPLGWNTATFRVWDGMRGIDYLASRPDIDAERIGCTGNSGGGTLTSYIMALDPRVKCAAPSCYITSQQVFFRAEGPQDAEQNIFNQIGYGMEHADYVMMRAPKPTLICAATNDFFRIEGTWDSFRDAKRLYTKAGFPERVDLVEANEQHGFTPHLRQGAARWMRRWLLGKDDAIVEQDAQVLTVEEVQCTPSGQVILEPGMRTVFDVMEEEEARLAEARAKWLAETPVEQARARIHALTGIRTRAELPEPVVEEGTVEVHDTPPAAAYQVEHLVFVPEEGIRLRAKLYVPKEPNGEAMIESVDGVIGAPSEEILDRVAQGRTVLEVEVRGTGASAPKTKLPSYEKVFGAGWRDFFTAYMLGKSYMGMQAEDLVICGRWLSKKTGASSISILAGKGLEPAAFHARALNPDLFASAYTVRPAVSWASTLRNPERAGSLMETVHGGLRYYDLPDLARLAE